MLLLKTLLPFIFYATCLGLEDNTPFVTTPLGKIRGHHKTSFNQRKFSAFEGIPYAKPPIGQRRFEEPEPIDQWDGTWNATHLYECAQINTITAKSVMYGDEDCLYVNVYVPREHINPSEKLDVIVHIHGGGFMALSGHSYAHAGYLMDHDVIFVTFNYRLGLLGFLSTEDDVIPGNNGLKDQVLALKWVQNNIASFGGDPRSVTITGASAGGASVHLHYLSPMSVGLFKRGFSQSGCALNPWAVQKGALEKARILALGVGCPQSPTQKLKECLKNRPYQQLLNKFRLFTAYKLHPLVPFGPVVEKGSNPFLAEDPKKLMSELKVQDLPWLVSFVEHDGYGFIQAFRNDIQEINEDWEKALPFVFFYNYTVERENWGKVARQIKDFYFGKNVDVTNSNFDRFTRFSTDIMTVTGSVQAVISHARAINSPTYLFDLSYTGDSSNIVYHGEDNKYFYYDENEKPLTKNELKMKDLLVNMLVSYARTGTPSFNKVDWKPVKEHQVNYLNISGYDVQDIHSQSNNDLGNQRFWNSVEHYED